LSGTLYDIDTSADKQVGAFTFQEEQILPQSNANCKGTNSCHGDYEARNKHCRSELLLG